MVLAVMVHLLEEELALAVGMVVAAAAAATTVVVAVISRVAAVAHRM